MTVKPSATTPNVEYVYGDRTDGHPQSGGATLPPERSFGRDQEEEQSSVHAGYVAARKSSSAGFERFGVQLRIRPGGASDERAILFP